MAARRQARGPAQARSPWESWWEVAGLPWEPSCSPYAMQRGLDLGYERHDGRDLVMLAMASTGEKVGFLPHMLFPAKQPPIHGLHQSLRQRELDL